MTSRIFLAVLLCAITSFADDIDPRGPIAYPGITTKVEPGIVQALGYVFENNCQKPSPWQAEWIWLGKDEGAAAAMFRKEITLAEKPASVKAWLTADAKYRLYINGRLVSRGPVDIGRDYDRGNTHHWFYDYRDLTLYFVAGKNCIAAEVFRSWPAGDNISRGQPGFLFEAEAKSSTGTVCIKSDASWRGQAARQYPSASMYDATKAPAGWRLSGFDDSSWAACRKVNDVWSLLVASEIPPLMEASYPVLRTEGLGADKKITKDSSFRIVFDRVLSARPALKVRGGKGAEMIVRGHMSASAILGGGDTFFEFPYMTEIVPSYTVEFKHVTSPIEILAASANFTSQPVDYRGDFSCSDEQLNKLWKVSRWTTQICLQTHHLDSPNHQEPICDPGDYVIESMVNYYAFHQPWLARQDIRKFAWLLKDEHYSNFHTSYSIAWLQMLMDYYDYTGDKTLVLEMAPSVHGLMEKYASWVGKNGLISEAPNYMFMDWVNIGGFECHHPPAVIGQGYLTALYYHGLDMASRVAETTGDKQLVERYTARRKEIAMAFQRELWVEAKGLYRDGKPFQSSIKSGPWLPADKNIETFSPHVNLLAVLYDLAPKDKQAAIVDKVMASGAPNTQPWFMHWVFQAIDHAGRFDRYGIPQMHRWQIVHQTQSFHEMWGGGDLSHGWCSTPLVQMSSVILGVKPTSPGFKTFEIRPQLCNLLWAKGTVPTPQGNVTVSWKHKRLTDDAPTEMITEEFEFDVEVPPGSVAEVVLPLARFKSPKILQDGREVRGSQRLSPGRHSFVVNGVIK